MNILTKSVAKEVTDAGMKNIRDMEFINTPIESSAVEIFYSKYWKFWAVSHSQATEAKASRQTYFSNQSCLFSLL